MTNKLLRKMNERFRDVGINPHGEPLYAWVRACDITFLRRTGFGSWYCTPAGLWTREPQYDRVLAFPRLKDRWVLGIWQGFTPKQWDRMFGLDMVRPSRGCYFPTDKVMRLGWEPTMDVTEYFISCIRYNRSKTPADFDREVEEEFAREDRQNFNKMVDMAMDAGTAFGKKPGSREGGVSIFSGKSSEPVDRVKEVAA